MKMTPERWQHVERLYHEALEREASQRAGFLREASPGDDALRREVESLLAQEDGGSLLEKPALEVAAKALAGDSGPSLLGRQIGGYQVICLLGAGGMGEVYEARDSKLGRKVAIKILPASFANDAERLARFQREARMLAALNHPNIATIYGLEQSDSVHYLVMELVPGQTLAERIIKGALPLDESLRIAGQIAQALEAAHEKGVIHRDLKPANIKVTPEGRAKVLDFGLAKAFTGDGAPELSQAPTLSEEGRILGTPSYMSPEQARGLPVDKRTDIWAFGCVLYEMLTGRTPFAGQTLSDILAAILKHEPDWGALRRQRRRRFAIYCVAVCRRIRNVDCAISATPDSKSRNYQPLRQTQHRRKPLDTSSRAVAARAVLARDLCCSSRLHGYRRLEAEAFTAKRAAARRTFSAAHAP